MCDSINPFTSLRKLSQSGLFASSQGVVEGDDALYLVEVVFSRLCSVVLLIFAAIMKTITVVAAVIESDISVNNHCRSGGGYHQHPIVCSEHFVVDVDADNCIRSHTAGTLRHLFHSFLTCFDQLALI